jgi:hypothetical protein
LRGGHRPDRYAHRDEVPRHVWQRLFGSAKNEIGVLDWSSLYPAEDASILATLADKARTGVSVRICLRDPGAPDVAGNVAESASDNTLAVRVRDALVQYGPLREGGGVEVRLHRDVLYGAIYRADDELLVSQHAYGIPAGRAPVVYLRRAGDGDLVAAYLESFEQIWASARPLK